jgi:uncharacterized membrane protein YfcA
MKALDTSTPILPATATPKPEKRRLLYPIAVITVYIGWFAYMIVSNNWHLFKSYWPASVTMILGSFVAGITAEGGGAVAFPVFTKVLHIPAPDARTFSLMIQSFGMTMAGTLIFSRRIKILPRVIGWVSLGGILGQILGTYVIPLPGAYPKIIFTFVTTAFGVALIINRWVFGLEPNEDVPEWNGRKKLLFVGIGIFGGMFAANFGSGIDVMTFMVLTLAFGVNEKISTPTTVIIMGINSAVGFILHGLVVPDINPEVWGYWLVSLPIVIIGAPLGAFVASKITRDSLIYFLLFLISLELVTTIWIIDFTTMQIIVSTITVAVFAGWFWVLLHYRHKILND